MPWNASVSCWPLTQFRSAAQVVAEMDVTGRLDAREHSGHGSEGTGHARSGQDPLQTPTRQPRCMLHTRIEPAWAGR